MALKYSSKTLIALTALQFVYLYRRDELLDRANGRETLLKFHAIRPRITHFEVSGKKLVIEDIKIIMGSDIFIVAEDSPYIFYFKLTNDQKIEFRQRKEYAYLPPGSTIAPSGRRLHFDMSSKLLLVFDSQSVYYQCIDSFVATTSSVLLETTGGGDKVYNTEAVAVVPSQGGMGSSTRIIWAVNDQRIVSWKVP